MTDSSQPDFRRAPSSKAPPRAVADAAAGIVIAMADIDAPPERVFRALTTNEVEQWWGHPDLYRQSGWTGELRVCGPWRVAVHLAAGGTVVGFGEFAELEPPRRVVMTRRFDRHPLLGDRETTITYRFEPRGAGTRLTVRDEGFIGRSEAAYGNAQVWEKVLGWLDAHLSTSGTSPLRP